MDTVAATAQLLKQRITELATPRDVLKASELKALFGAIKDQPENERQAYGQAVNALRQELESLIVDREQAAQAEAVVSIDVTAPWDINTVPADRPRLFSADEGSIHPLMKELDYILDIYTRMGFEAVESRQIDDDFHMFESLNFPEGHPARDDYDTFMTEDGLIAPAHTSTMQHRVMKVRLSYLEQGKNIAVVIPGRVFRNEDLDATHEHTFNQFEGVYVGKGITVGNLIAILRTFMSEYFGQSLQAKIQPFYFPFTEPSFEFAIERPDSLKKDNTEAEQWLELLGCGMIHPNVLRQAGIDPTVYTGFAWGCGIERLVLMKYGIEDIRHFESGRLSFLKQFKGVV
ncbi:phenylalanine--tRNA ligase subunit alpha [Pedobacter sp.]|nr:phenylalanine--tRNA ligase subunit alpha [Candidatus Saccharibacteria bacterium]